MNRDFFHLRDQGRLWRVFYDEIQYLESDNKYTKIVTAERAYLMLQALGKIEQALPSDIFYRIHRSYIISLLHASFDHETAFIGKNKLPISKQYRVSLHARLFILENNSPVLVQLSEYDMLKFFKNINLH